MGIVTAVAAAGLVLLFREAGAEAVEVDPEEIAADDFGEAAA